MSDPRAKKPDRPPKMPRKPGKPQRGSQSPQLASYSADGAFHFDAPPTARPDIPEEHGIASESVNPGKAAINTERPVVVQDWNRFMGGSDADSKIFIMVNNEEKSLFSLVQEFAKTHEEYFEEKAGVKVFKDGQKGLAGLKIFWAEYLFKDVPEAQRAKIIDSAGEYLHQGGVATPADMLYGADLANGNKPEHKNLNLRQKNNRMVYTPTKEGVSITATSQYDNQQSQPAIKLLAVTNLVVDENLNLSTPTKINVQIYDKRLQSFVLGRGFIEDHISAYQKNMDDYHPPSDKKEMLDQLMQRIISLHQEGGNQKELTSLFYIYSALKDLDYANKSSLEIYHKTYEDHYKLVSPDDIGIIKLDIKEIKKKIEWHDEFDKLSINKMKVFENPELMLYLHNSLGKDSSSNINFLNDLHDMQLGIKPFDGPGLVDKYIKEGAAQPVMIDDAIREAIITEPDNIEVYKSAFNQITKSITDELSRSPDVTMADIRTKNLESALINSGMKGAELEEIKKAYHEIIKPNTNPNVEDVILIKIQLAEAIKNCKEEQDKNLIRDTIKSIDNKWNYKREFAKLRLNSSGTEFKNTISMMKELDDDFKKLNKNNPQAILLFQQKAVMYKELASFDMNKEGYNTQPEKKAMLDQLMQRMMALYESKNSKELTVTFSSKELSSLFNIYSALREWDFSNQDSIKMFNKIVENYAKYLSTDNKVYVENIYGNMYKAVTQPVSEDWQKLFSALYIDITDNKLTVHKLSVFDDPAFITAAVDYSNRAFVTENMHFLIQVRQMVQYPEKFDPMKLINLYLLQNSPNQVNLSSDLRKIFDDAMNNGGKILDKESNKLRELTIDDFKIATGEIINIMNRDTFKRAKTDDTIIKINASEVVSHISDALLQSGMKKGNASQLNEEFNKIKDASDPNLKDVMSLKKKLMSAMENCNDIKDKEYIQRAIGIVDSKWNHRKEFADLNGLFQTTGFKEHSDALFKTLEQLYEKLDINDPSAILDFQRKCMLAIELVSAIVRYAQAEENKGDVSKAIPMAFLLVELNAELKLDMKAKNAEHIYDAMKGKFLETYKESVKASVLAPPRRNSITKMLAYVVRDNPDIAVRLKSFCEAVTNDIKYEKEKAAETAMLANKKEDVVQTRPRAVGMRK